MKTTIKGFVTAVGVSETFGLSSGSFGTTVYDGVRVEMDGRATWIPRLVCAGYTASLIERAMEEGEEVELWLSGPAGLRLAYAIRTCGERHYDTAGIPLDATLVGIRYVILGLVMLFFVIGIPVLMYGLYQFYRAYLFKPALGRDMFDKAMPVPRASGSAVYVTG